MSCALLRAISALTLLDARRFRLAAKSIERLLREQYAAKGKRS